MRTAFDWLDAEKDLKLVDRFDEQDDNGGDDDDDPYDSRIRQQDKRRFQRAARQEASSWPPRLKDTP